MRIVACTGLVLLALAGCGQATSAPGQGGGDKTEIANGAPASTPTKSVSTTQATRATVDLRPYIGKYPFDVVGGYRFLDNPAVKTAIAAAVPDAKERATIKYSKGDLGIPIIKVAGGRILFWGGASRAEDRYNWSVVIAPDGSKPEVCIYDGVGYDGDIAGGTDQDVRAAQWYEPGHAIMKMGSCPASAEDYPAKDIAAG